jgi:uncharacterized protein (TIGR00369 family)
VNLPMSASNDIPEGFRPAKIPGEFLQLAGPLYGRWTPQSVALGFRVEARHTNPLGICHGGMLATLCDMLVPLANIYRPGGVRQFLPTISLNIDYMGPARLGAWVQGEAQVLKTTRNMLFGQGLVTADGQPALRFNGVFKLGQALDWDNPDDPWGLR